jgi:hypothetical protein
LLPLDTVIVPELFAASVPVQLYVTGGIGVSMYAEHAHVPTVPFASRKWGRAPDDDSVMATETAAAAPPSLTITVSSLIGFPTVIDTNCCEARTSGNGATVVVVVVVVVVGGVVVVVGVAVVVVVVGGGVVVVVLGVVLVVGGVVVVTGVTVVVGASVVATMVDVGATVLVGDVGPSS